MIRLEDILEKVSQYSDEKDLDVIKKAYVFSGMVHQGQIRKSGDPYLVHPLEVAMLLADMKMDPNVVATGLLHDTVEDTHASLEKIEETFGEEVAQMVDGLTKLSRLKFESKEDREAENFRKMIVAMAKDIRIIIIKLADRLHNMRTLMHLSREKQKIIALETLEIYAPLANRLGVGWIKTELEDLSFMYLTPDKYRLIKERVSKKEEEKQEYIKSVTEAIEEKIKEASISGKVFGRFKHSYSIYKKIEDHDMDFEHIYDIIAFRIVVNSIRDCYTVLGLIHGTWKPIPGRFKDYIALAKPNLYQALHTTVIGPYGERMEIQIRTEEMHRIAEHGIAAHWKYKDIQVGGDGSESAQGRFTWLRQLLEWEKDLKDSGEFMETLKGDLFEEEVFVFTPGGEMKVFPNGATPIDFAYNVHTDIGEKCTGVKINGRLASVDTKLKNGDVVEVLTSENQKPSTQWLSFVVTSRARNRIRQSIKHDEREQSIKLGKEICFKEFRKRGFDFNSFVKSGEMQKVVVEDLGLHDLEHLYTNIGYGKLPVTQIMGKFMPKSKIKDTSGASRFFKVFDKFNPFDKDSAVNNDEQNAVAVDGIENVMFRFARCCNPLPGEQISAFMSHGQGITIHNKSCPNTRQIDMERKVDVYWQNDENFTRRVELKIFCKNTKGVLADISSTIVDGDANISGAEIKTEQNKIGVCFFEIEVRDINHLRDITSSLEFLDNVTKVVRSDRFAKLDDSKEETV